MANRMYNRSLVTHVGSNVDSSQHVVVAHQNLADFQTETVTNMNELMDHVNHLHKRMQSVEELIRFAEWVKELYPHLIKDWSTSERVAQRLTDDTPTEQCESAS